MPASILIAGEPANRRVSYARAVRSLGNVIETGFGDGAAVAGGHRTDVLILCATADTSRNGIDLLIAHAATHPDAPVVVISEHAGEDLAVAALRSRVRHYLTGPVERDNLLCAVQACLQMSAARPASVATSELGLIGASLSMQRVREYAPLAARSDCPVLITGETGTGKELVAQFVHASSARSGKAFVPLNCAAIPETLLESELFGYERGAFTGAGTSRDGKMRQAHGGAVPRRNRRTRPVCPGEDPPRHRDQGGAAPRRARFAARRLSRGRCHEPGFGIAGRDSCLPAGPLLPAQHRTDPAGSAAGTS